MKPSDKPNEEALFEETVPLDSYPTPAVPERKIPMHEHLLMSSYWFGSNFVWGALLGVVNGSVIATMSPGQEYKLLGWLSTLGAFPALVIPLVAGALSDRCASKWGRRRPYILFGGLVAVLGLVMMLFASRASSLEFYFAAYFVVQFGANTALAAYSGVIPDLVPHSQHGVASGYMAFMSQFSTLAGAFIGGKYVKHSPELLFLVLIAVFVLFLVITLVGVREKPLEEKPPPLDWVEYLKSLWIDPKKYPDFAWVWITRALMMFGFYAIQPFILYYLRDQIHVKNPETQAGLLIGVILIGSTVSGMLGGAISDRIGRKPVVYASSFLIGIMALSFIFLHSLGQVMICGVIFGIGYGAYISVDWALGTDVLPNKDDAAKDMGVWHVSMTLPQQIAPFCAGYVLQLVVSKGSSLGDHATRLTYGYGAVFTIASACFLVGGYLLKNVRGTR